MQNLIYNETLSDILIVRKQSREYKLKKERNFELL
jgi:hypothetical protein